MIDTLLQCLFWYTSRMIILDNFHCDEQIMFINQYNDYYYVYFKLFLLFYFLSDYCNFILATIT